MAGQRNIELLCERLIRSRWAVVLGVALVTAAFGWRASKLRMATDLGDLLPSRHPFVQTHERYAAELAGANTVTVLVEAPGKTIFTVEHLAQLYLITQALDAVPGVNHHRVDSLAHRTARRLRVGRRGTLRSEPIMRGIPATEADAAAIRRAAHESETIYGKLVSLDDEAALVRADFLDGRVDYRRIFDELQARVVVPYARGWIGAHLVELDTVRAEKLGLGAGIGLLVDRLYADGAAAKAGLRPGDVVILVDGRTAHTAAEVAQAVATGRDGVELGYLRGGKPHTLTLRPADSGLRVEIAGEPQLYGWIYHYAREIVWIFAAAAVFGWGLVFLYFHDWRGALRPAVTGVVAATWGLGFTELIGSHLDPLALVVPFFITARAVTHSVQMHDRYYQEYFDRGFDKHAAIVGAYCGLFVPALTAIFADALGVLVMLLVPVPLLQRLAVTAAFWIVAIAATELLLSPALYSALHAPDPDIVQRRAAGPFQYVIARFARAVLSPAGCTLTLVFWVAAALACSTQWSKLVIGDATSITPLLDRDSPYNRAHVRIQDRFGGSEPLIVVAEGADENAMKDPQVLATMQRFQRYLERDPAVGSSFSLADVASSASSALHDLEPKWGVLTTDRAALGEAFFLRFAGSPPPEAAKYVSGGFRSAPVTFYARGHKGSDVARLAARARDFIERNPTDAARFVVAGGVVGLLAAANEQLARNAVLMNVLGFGAIFVVLLLTFRCSSSALLMLMPLIAANLAINAYMAWRGIGLTLQVLPVIAVGIGFGIDFCLYLVGRVREAYAALEKSYAPAQARERLRAALLDAMTTSGKSITLAAVTMFSATMFWTVSRIRFDAEMGLLLGMWIAVSWAATLTLLPVMLTLLRPSFVQSKIPVRS